jgi:hypothetical protein
MSENLTLGRPSFRGMHVTLLDFKRLEDWHAACLYIGNRVAACSQGIR